MSTVLTEVPEQLADAELSGEKSDADGRTTVTGMLQADDALSDVVIAVEVVVAVLLEQVELEARLDELAKRFCDEVELHELELERRSRESGARKTDRRREATERSPPAPTLGKDSKAGGKKEAACSCCGELSKAATCSRACLRIV